MQASLLADRIDRWAGSRVTTCAGQTVYGAAALRDFLVDLLQSKGGNISAAKADARNVLKSVPCHNMHWEAVSLF